jgi:hypothetical protein
MNQRRPGSFAVGVFIFALVLLPCGAARAQLGAARSTRELDRALVDGAEAERIQAAIHERPSEDVVTLQSEAADRAEAKILRALEEPVSLSFRDRELAEVVDYLGNLSGLSIRLDAKALEDASIGSGTLVTCSVPATRLRAALSLLLGPLDLTWVIKHDVLLVTTPEKACNELLTRIYPVRDLTVFRREDRIVESYEALIEMITCTIAPTTWDEVGGPGSIHEFRPAAVIVVSQTREVHDQIMPLLTGIRRARDLQPPSYDLATTRRSSSSRFRAAPAAAELREPPRYVVTPKADWLVPRVHE